MVLMNKQDIVSKFIEKGFQLDPHSLDFFFQNSDKIDIFLKKSNVDQQNIITKETIDSIFKTVQPNIQILKTYNTDKKTMTVENSIQFFNNRYEKMRKILSGRFELVNLISINKVTPTTKKFSVIGMIAEKDNDTKSIVVEDTTGEMKIFFDSVNNFSELLHDEVIGIVCEKDDDSIKAKSVIFPDIPLRREINKTKDDIYCIFVSDFHMDDANFNKKSFDNFLDWIGKIKYEKFYIFVLGDISSDKNKIKNFLDSLPEKHQKIFQQGDIDGQQENILSITDPCLLKLENTTLFLSHGNFLNDYMNLWNTSPEQTILNLIKKRNMNPSFDINKKIGAEDQYFLDTIPDIFVTGHFHKPGMINYKGTTIISNGSFINQPVYWMINLRTRETIKIDFT